MKMVKDMHRIGKVSKDSANIGWGQIGGHSFETHLLPPEDFPEPFQGLSAFALADKNDGTAFQVKHDGQVAMSFADGDFSDDDLLQFVELGERKTPDQVSFLNIFDNVPTDSQMPGHILIWSCAATVPEHNARKPEDSSAAKRQI
jgi:hypothetical protein